jgi:ABC-type multidrug transport system fused ATPase/permease subunit
MHSLLYFKRTPVLVTTVAFWSFTKLEGRELTAPVAFTSLAVFNELRFALTAIPEFVIRLSETLISVRRIDKYLAEEEINTAGKGENALVPLTEVKIGFENATVGWPSSFIGTTLSTDAGSSSETSTLNQLEENTNNKASSFVLKDLNVTFPNNQLSLICGPTGSGKTLLVLSLLGETETKEGSVYCPRSAPFSTLDDSTAITSFKLPAESDIVPPHWVLDHAVAYVSQTAWLQNTTIKNNILFGLPYATKRYQATLTACALDKDLSYFEDGDETEIGEKGITLSGGQKARVALARAVYSRAQNVLLDDVLAAVDAFTAKHLYQRCLLGPLMKGRTQILITHHVNLCIHESAYVVLVKDCRIQSSGTPADLKANGQMSLLFEENLECQDSKKEEPGDTEETIDGSPSVEVKQKKPKALVEEEERAEGMIKLKLYRLYYKLIGGYVFWTAFGLMIVGARCLDIGSSWWLKQWARSYETNDNSTVLSATWNDLSNYQMPVLQSDAYTSTNDSKDQRNSDLNMYLVIYALINLLSIVIGTTRHAAILWGGVKASKALYKLLLDRVFRAPLRFFDTTPTGRIVNRFAKDFETIDTSVPPDLVQFVIQWVCVVSILIVSSAALPILLVPMFLVGLVNVYFGMRFSFASRALKRMDSVSRSPLFTQFSETIVGVTTIRAFGMTQQFMLDMLNRIDVNSRPMFYAWSIGRWVSVRISFMGSAITFVTGVVILRNLDSLDAAMAGFCLSYVSVFTDMVSLYHFTCAM